MEIQMDNLELAKLIAFNIERFAAAGSRREARESAKRISDLAQMLLVQMEEAVKAA